MISQFGSPAQTVNSDFALSNDEASTTAATSTRKKRKHGEKNSGMGLQFAYYVHPSMIILPRPQQRAQNR
jgi:hypothetical protein